MYAIYIHKNLINGKIYIGCTKHYNCPTKRWRNGQHYNYKIKCDLLTYDWYKDFSHKILLVVNTKEEAAIYEKYFIEFYQSTKYGYNITEDGRPSFNISLLRNLSHNRKNILSKKRLKYLKIINAITNKEVFYGSRRDVLNYAKSNIYPLITAKTLLQYINDSSLLKSELNCNDYFIIKKSIKRKF